MDTYLRGTPCWLPRIERSFSRAPASSAAASSFEKGCQPRPMRKRPLMRNAFMETASQGTGLLKNLLGSAGFRQGGAEVLRQVLCDLSRDALHDNEVLQARLREVLRGLEAGVDQGLRPRLPDPLNPHEVLEDVRLGRLRGLELEDPPLDALVPRAPLERLRVRPQGVVGPARRRGPPRSSAAGCRPSGRWPPLLRTRRGPPAFVRGS